MKVYVRNKMVSLTGGSTVVDENEQPVYEVKGKFFSPTHKKKILDNQGKLLYVVRNKWFYLFSRSALIYDEKGEKIARVKKIHYSFKNKFVIEGYKDEIVVDGSLFSTSKMPVVKNGVEIGYIKKEVTFVKDCFCVEADEAEMPFLVALTIAIDNILDKKERDEKK